MLIFVFYVLITAVDLGCRHMHVRMYRQSAHIGGTLFLVSGVFQRIDAFVVISAKLNHITLIFFL